MDSDIKMRSRGRWWKGHVYIHMPRLASEPPELDPLRGRNTRKDKQIISRFSISSARLYKIKRAVKDIMNKSNIIFIHF
jgi:hypothetical protein